MLIITIVAILSLICTFGIFKNHFKNFWHKIIVGLLPSYIIWLAPDFVEKAYKMQFMWKMTAFGLIVFGIMYLMIPFFENKKNTTKGIVHE